jgi:glutamate carboxypeptidase
MICDNLFEIIDSLEEKYLQFLVDVCDIESPTEYKEGVDKVGKYFIEKAKEKDWQVEEQIQTVSGNCVCITLNPKASGQAVCFSGHMDTVHPIGSFGEKPTKIDGDIIHGPGVIDCKGGIVASFMAMDALEKCGFKDRPIKLILQSDEENGSRKSNKATISYICEKVLYYAEALHYSRM